ncbi:MAG: class I SAM-dependent methyltransferase [Rhizobiales bacterium]|jgi:precorrin-6B methylase 2|nr:class I SAM-dependent methyltransferase [Hyphomicrobiales bacterium]
MQSSKSGFRALAGIAALTALVFGAGLYSLNVSAQPKLDIHFVPTPHEVVKRMLELAKVGPDDIHYDLGSGDGRIVIAAVKDFKAKKGVGIDLDPQRIKEANENKAKAGVGDNVTFREQNIFETDLSEASTVSMYLLTSINIRMRPKLLKELKPGTRIVTHAFNMGEWKEEHSESVEGYQVYLFIVPANVNGKWEVSEGERKISLDLKSEFTELSGTATVNGKSSTLKDSKITGTKIEFTIDLDGKPVKYEGNVDGGTITGSGASKWSAKKS